MNPSSYCIWSWIQSLSLAQRFNYGEGCDMLRTLLISPIGVKRITSSHDEIYHSSSYPAANAGEYSVYLA